jgi:hypothetical protein
MKIPAKECSAEDLELSDEDAENLLSVWANFTLICPVLDDVG